MFKNIAIMGIYYMNENLLKFHAKYDYNIVRLRITGKPK